MGFRGLGLRVWGFGFRVYIWFRVWGFRVKGWGFWILGLDSESRQGSTGAWGGVLKGFI